MCETGRFEGINYAAVHLPNNADCHYEVMLQYLIDEHDGKAISANVQGYGITSKFKIEEISEDEYFKSNPAINRRRRTHTEYILLSEEPLEGYPYNIKVISKHIELR